MKRSKIGLCLLGLLLPGLATAAETSQGLAAENRAELVAALGARERAFAATVRAKDLEAFGSFIAEGAVFAAGQSLRGRQAILDGWAGLFDPAAAVLAWEPCVVEIEASGRIGFTRGPYWFEEAGSDEVAQGTFVSVWERQADGAWKIILDTGTPPTPGPPIVEPCAPSAPAP